MITKKLPLGPLEANTYIVVDEESKEAAIVDSTGDSNKIKEELEKLGAKLKYILLTHGHFDHVMSVCEMKKLFPDAKVIMHKEDEVLVKNLKTQCTFFGMAGSKEPKIDEFADENTKLSLGSTQIKVIHTPGHSKGSVCYLIEDTLFCGDTLFYEEIGRCDLFGGSFDEIEKSIRGKLFTLDEKTKVCPGHGIDSTIGHEKKQNAYFGENSRY